MSIPAETRREAYEESRKEAPTRCKRIYRRLCEDGPMKHIYLVFLYIVPLCLIGSIEQGASLWLTVPAFASILFGWYLGWRGGEIL